MSVEKIATKTCHNCYIEVSEDDFIEFQEFVEIKHRCGYGSIFEDGSVLHVDLCQHCFKALLGNIIESEKCDYYW